MTIERLMEFISAVLIMRENATDEQAVAASGIFPEWEENTTCEAGKKYLHNGTLYRCLITHTSQAGWEPGVSPSLFAEVLAGQEGTAIGEWKQPDSTNPYMSGDKVTHNGKTWESSIDNNVWEPGVYGWNEV